MFKCTSLGAQLDNLFREAAMASLRESVENTKVSNSDDFFVYLRPTNKHLHRLSFLMCWRQCK